MKHWLSATIGVLLLSLLLLLPSTSFAANNKQVISTPPELEGNAELFGIGLGGTTSLDAFAVAMFNSTAPGYITVQVYRLNSDTGLFEEYGPLIAPPENAYDPPISTLTQTDPLALYISDDWTTLAIGFFLTDPSPTGHVYIYYDNCTGYVYGQELFDNTTAPQARLWGSNIRGTPDGSLLAIGAPVYPYSNTTSSIVSLFRYNTTSAAYELESTVAYGPDLELSLWGYTFALSNNERWLAVSDFYSGFVQLFERNLTGTNYNFASNIYTIDGHNFGYSIAFSGDSQWISIGAFRFPGSFSGLTVTYFFNSTADAWDLTGAIHDWPSKTSPTPGQGASIGMCYNGSLMAFGMPYADDGLGEVGIWQNLGEPINLNWTAMLPALAAFGNMSINATMLLSELGEVDSHIITALLSNAEIDAAVNISALSGPVNIGWPLTTYPLISADGSRVVAPGPGNIGVVPGFVFYWDEITSSTTECGSDIPAPPQHSPYCTVPSAPEPSPVAPPSSNKATIAITVVVVVVLTLTLALIIAGTSTANVRTRASYKIAKRS